ncbi:S8 family serine peptidase [Chloroflexota bacterium]
MKKKRMLRISSVIILCLALLLSGLLYGADPTAVTSASTHTAADTSFTSSGSIGLITGDPLHSFTKVPPPLDEIAAEYVPGEIIVKYKQEVSGIAVSMFNQSIETSVIYTSPYAGFKVIRIPRGKTVAEMIEVYSEQSIVEYAEPNYIYRAQWTPNDPQYSDQWHFDQINLEGAWDLDMSAPSYGGDPGVVVAVLDSGVAYEDYGPYYQAPDLANTNFWVNPGEIPGNVIDDDGNGFVDDINGWDFVNHDGHPNDDDGHGTHVTGTIAQSTNNGVGVAGVAFNTTIMPVKILNHEGGATEQQVADGIYYAANNGADILNMSLGGPHAISVENAIAHAYSSGCTIVCAAGNDKLLGNPPNYPAAYDAYCIAVGAVRYDLTRSYYSNTGAYLDVVAPGGDTGVDQNGDGLADGVIQQTFGGSYSNFGYVPMQGTSMACPHVAGVAALILAANPGLSPDDVRSALESTATDLGVTGWDSSYGWGLMDAEAAVPLVVAGVRYNGHTINDSAENNNGLVDTGESILLGVTLLNPGSSSATDVSAVLSTADPYVTMTDGYEAWGTIGAGSSVARVDAFAFDVAGDTPDQHSIDFQIEATGTGSSPPPWISDFSVIVNAPAFEVGAIEIDDSSGNGNGMLEPGETANVLVPTSNVGHADALSTTGSLSCTSGYLTVNSGSHDFGTLLAGGSETASFSVTASAGTPFGTVIYLDYSVTSGSYSAENSFPQIVGVTEVQVGDGTGTGYYPFRTIFLDSRTQSILLADEIQCSMIIENVKLYCTGRPGNDLGNFYIRMQHTTMDAFPSNSFINSGWTTVLHATDVDVSAWDTPGWVEFELETPFPYNGTDNLLIDYCLDNDTSTFSGQCRATTGTDRTLYHHTDLPTGNLLNQSTANNMGDWYNNIILVRYVLPEYVLTATSSDGGDVTGPGEGSFAYAQGAIVDLLAVAEPGFRFLNWTGDVGTVADVNAAGTTITMDNDYSIQANFEEIPIQYDLTAIGAMGGSVADPGEGVFTYDEGTVVALLAVPDLGFDFVNWTGDVGTVADVNAADTTITMDNDYSIQANFIEIDTSQLTVTSSEGGDVTDPGEGSYTYTTGNVADLLAVPEAGFVFCSWTGDVAMVDDVNAADAFITMNGDYSITANFRPDTAYPEIHLVEGLNLIGLQLTPFDTSIESVLACIMGKVVIVYNYDPSSEGDHWTVWDPVWGGNLSEMVAGKGYWIRMSADATLRVDGYCSFP